VRNIPSRWEPGDAVLLAQAPEASLAAEAALVRFLWKAAPLLTLCHDVGHAGLAHALAECEEWSGRPADVALPDEPAHGAAILACRPEDVSKLGTRGFVQIGAVR
jgi:hypothetical protein